MFYIRDWIGSLGGGVMRLSGLRGLGGAMTMPPQIMVSVPQPAGDPPTMEPTAETSLANAAYQDANDYSQFTAASNTPNYATPAAYTANMIQYAQTLCYGSGAPYTCFTNSGGSFNPTTMGTQYANAVFAALKATPYGSTNVYDYWVAHPIPVEVGYTPPAPVTPYNPQNVPGSSVLPTPPTVLTPPTTTPPVTPTQIQNGTTGTQGTTGGLDMSSVTPWLEGNWQLLAAGLAALVILPMVLGGRR